MGIAKSDNGPAEYPYKLGGAYTFCFNGKAGYYDSESNG